MSVAALGLGWGLMPACAESTINVDLQPGPSGATHSTEHSGQGALADPGQNVWNVVAPPVDGYTSAWGSGGNFSFPDTYSSGGLVDSSGGLTRVNLTVHRGDPLGTTFAVNPENAWPYSHLADNAKNLMKDYLIAPGGGTNAVVISGLVPGAKYTLCLYGAGDQNTHQTTFIVGGASQTTAGVPHEGSHNLTEGVDFVLFAGVEAAGGTVTIQYTGAGKSRDGNFNGLQVRGERPALTPEVEP